MEACQLKLKEALATNQEKKKGSSTRGSSASEKCRQQSLLSQGETCRPRPTTMRPPDPSFPLPTITDTLPAAPEVAAPVRSTAAPLLPLLVVPVLRCRDPLTPLEPALDVRSVNAPLLNERP